MPDPPDPPDSDEEIVSLIRAVENLRIFITTIILWEMSTAVTRINESLPSLLVYIPRLHAYSFTYLVNKLTSMV